MSHNRIQYELIRTRREDHECFLGLPSIQVKDVKWFSYLDVVQPSPKVRNDAVKYP